MYDLIAQQTKLLTTSTVAIYKHKPTIMIDYMSPITHAVEILKMEQTDWKCRPSPLKLNTLFQIPKPL